MPSPTPRSEEGAAGTSGGKPGAERAIVIEDSDTEPGSQPPAPSSPAGQHVTVAAAGMAGIPRRGSPGRARGSAGPLQREPGKRKRLRTGYHLGASLYGGDALRAATRARDSSQGSAERESGEESETSGASPPGSGPSHKGLSGQARSGGECSGLTGSLSGEDPVTQALGIRHGRTRRQHVDAQRRAPRSQFRSSARQHSGARSSSSVRDEERPEQSAVSALEDTAQTAAVGGFVSSLEKATARHTSTNGRKSSLTADATGDATGQESDTNAADTADASSPPAAAVTDAIESDRDSAAARLEAEQEARQQALNEQQAMTEALLAAAGVNREVLRLQPFHFDKCVLCAPCSH